MKKLIQKTARSLTAVVLTVAMLLTGTSSALATDLFQEQSEDAVTEEPTDEPKTEESEASAESETPLSEIVKYDFENGTGMVSTGFGTDPQVVNDAQRGNVLQFADGASSEYVSYGVEGSDATLGVSNTRIDNGSPSSLRFDNPLCGRAIDGATVSMWVKVPAGAAASAPGLVGFVSDNVSRPHPDQICYPDNPEKQRLQPSTGPYAFGITASGLTSADVDAQPMLNMTGLHHNWYSFLDEDATFAQKEDEWVYMTVSLRNGIYDTYVYINGQEVSSQQTGGKRYNKGELNAGNVTNTTEPTLLEILTMAEMNTAYVGYTGFSPTVGGVCIDDLTFYEGAASGDEAQALYEAALAAPTPEETTTPTDVPAVTEEPAEESVLYGDVDLDCSITAVDSLIILRAVVGRVILDEAQTKSADVDGDGEITSYDALYVLDYVVKWIGVFPAEDPDAAAPALDMEYELTADGNTVYVSSVSGEWQTIPRTVIQWESDEEVAVYCSTVSDLDSQAYASEMIGYIAYQLEEDGRQAVIAGAYTDANANCMTYTGPVFRLEFEGTAPITVTADNGASVVLNAPEPGETTRPTQTPEETTEPTQTPEATATPLPETKPIPENDIDFSVDEKNDVTFDNYKGNDESISLPSEVDGKPLTKIGEGAFAENSQLKTVTIPEGVTEIEKDAFAKCESLTEIMIPESVTVFGDGIFEDCPNVTILCYANTSAHAYAVANGIAYKLLTEETASVVYGDLNGDGKVEASDALYVLRIVVGLKESTAQQKEAADVDADGFVTATDALLILKKVVGLFDIFPAEMK